MDIKKNKTQQRIKVKKKKKKKSYVIYSCSKFLLVGNKKENKNKEQNQVDVVIK